MSNIRFPTPPDRYDQRWMGEVLRTLENWQGTGGPTPDGTLPRMPRLTRISQVLGSTGLVTDLSVVCEDPNGRGGELRAWLNASSATDADPAVAADGTIAITSEPGSVTPASVWSLTGGGTGQLFNDIRVHPGRNKRVYLEFVTVDNQTTGRVEVQLRSEAVIVNTDGTLINSAISNAAQVAAGLLLVEVYPAPLPSRPDGVIAFNTTTKLLYKREAGLWVEIVNATEMVGQIIAGQIAVGAVRAAAILVDDLSVLGLSRFDDAVNIRAGLQIGPAGASFNAPGTKRFMGDPTGSLALKVTKAGTEGTKAVLGDFTVVRGAVPVDKTDASWTDDFDSVSTVLRGSWIASSGYAENTLTGADLPNYDGNLRIQGKITAEVVGASGTTDGEVHARLRVYVSESGGAYVDKGIIGTADIYSDVPASSTQSFDGTIGGISTSATTIVVRLVPEVMTNAVGGVLSGAATVDETDVTNNSVRWKKLSGGSTTLTRRGTFLGKESAQPHLSFEPLQSGEIPVATDLAEGELFYDGVAHVFKYFDGTSIVTL